MTETLPAKYTFKFDNRHDFTVNAAPYGKGALAAELLSAMVKLYQKQGSMQYKTVKSYDSTIRVFVRDIQAASNVQNISNLVAEDLNKWESTLAERYPTGRTALTHQGVIKRLLKEINEGAAFSDDIQHYMSRTMQNLSTKATPNQHYTDSENEYIKSLCNTAVVSTIKRLNQSHTPESSVEEEVLQYFIIHKTSPSRGSTLANKANRFKLSPALIPGSIAPTSNDLLSFLILFVMQTGWPPTTVVNLKRDCLIEVKNGTVGVRTSKNSRGKLVEETTFVPDGAVSSPGGILRKVLQLTQILETKDSDNLWLWWSSHKNRVHDGSSLLQKSIFREFAKNNGVVMGEGDCPDIQLVKVKQTYSIKQHKIQEENVPGFTTGNTPSVIQHYGNLSGSINRHLDTMRNALKEVIAVTDITSDEEGEKYDTSFATGCKDYLNSPYYPKDTVCKAVPALCYTCPNSIISPMHLPMVMQNLKDLEIKALELEPDEWVKAYGQAWININESVLPHFSEKEKRDAEEEATKRPRIPMQIGLR